MAARSLSRPQQPAPSPDLSGREPGIDSDPQSFDDGGGYDDDEDDFGSDFLEDDSSLLDQDEEEEELSLFDYPQTERYPQFHPLSSACLVAHVDSL